jgi:cellulose synthase operon protein YhjQ
MGSRGGELNDHSTSDSTPEDVAVLYSWANLQGAKYRDYSASRREHRAQVRYRAAKALLERELKAQSEAELSAEEAEREAFKAEAVAHSQTDQDSQAARLASLRNAEAAARKAVSERVEAARRTEAAARATVLAVREEREIAEARASVQQQAMIYTESELRRRQLAGPQPRLSLGGASGNLSAGPVELDGEGLDQSTLAQPVHPGSEPAFAGVPHLGLEFAQEARLFDAETGPSVMEWPLVRRAQGESPRSDSSTEGVEAGGVETDLEQTSPAWLYTATARPRTPMAGTLPALGLEPLAGDTLQDSRERVAARWFALKGVFEQSGPEFPALPPARPGEVRTPVLAVFSLAGGVGKTSLVATLGRALSAQGESVVLTDTTAHGLLPFYFGARELRAGVVRAFPPPADKAGQPISLVIYDAAASIAEELHQNVLTEEILRNGTGNHRLLLDLSSGSSWLVYRMVNLHPTVLVPITPDMNSVISLQAVERVFRGIVDSAGRPLLPYYLLNQFDAALPLHLDVREVFRRKLGDRLLPFAIRHSPAVSEALAEGMTVVDYAPTEAVAQDFLAVAAWLRTLSPPARDGLRGLRWGER